MALSGKLLGVPATIVMPTDAPTVKLEATRGYGAEVVLYDASNEDRQKIAEKLAAERGLTLIPPFDHPHILAGQGTAAKELIEETGPLDILHGSLRRRRAALGLLDRGEASRRRSAG